MKAAIPPFAAALALGLAACTTVHQKPVEGQQASFDGADQNSGIIAKVPGGYIVTPHFRDRYNALIDAYGAAKFANGAPVFTPKLHRDDGISPLTPQTYFCDNETMQNVVVLSGLKRRGAPAN